MKTPGLSVTSILHIYCRVWFPWFWLLFYHVPVTFIDTVKTTGTDFRSLQDKYTEVEKKKIDLEEKK